MLHMKPTLLVLVSRQTGSGVRAYAKPAITQQRILCIDAEPDPELNIIPFRNGIRPFGRSLLPSNRWDLVYAREPS